MPLTAYDSATDFSTIGQDAPAHAIKALGYDAVGVYLDPRRCSLKMIEDGHAVGLRFFSIYEKQPENVQASWFTVAQAQVDATAACLFAAQIGQPKGTPICYAVDADLAWDDVSDYVKAVHGWNKQQGYAMGLYGDWELLSAAVEAGYCDFTYLSGSKGWEDYPEGVAAASILQTNMNLTVLGMNCDGDTINDESVCW